MCIICFSKNIWLWSEILFDRVLVSLRHWSWRRKSSAKNCEFGDASPVVFQRIFRSNFVLQTQELRSVNIFFQNSRLCGVLWYNAWKCLSCLLAAIAALDSSLDWFRWRMSFNVYAGCGRKALGASVWAWWAAEIKATYLLRGTFSHYHPSAVRRMVMAQYMSSECFKIWNSQKLEDIELSLLTES